MFVSFEVGGFIDWSGPGNSTDSWEDAERSGKGRGHGGDREAVGSLSVKRARLNRS